MGDKLIQWWDAGPYSHCELIFSDNLWAGARAASGQVSGVQRTTSPDRWDYVTLPASYEPFARAFYGRTKGMGYDLLGQIRFVFSPYRGRGDKYWCSEWVAEAIGLREPWRYGPNGLYNVLHTLQGSQE